MSNVEKTGSPYQPTTSWDEVSFIEHFVSGAEVPQTEVESVVSGYRMALDTAEGHLKQIFRNLHQRTPQIAKSARVSWHEFGRQYYADYDFTEANRERAEKIGIHYIGRVVDLIPESELEDEIRIAGLDLKEHYVAELLPIVPDEQFLNHDRILYRSSIFNKILYFLLIGEGKLQIEDPFDRHSITGTLSQAAIENLILATSIGQKLRSGGLGGSTNDLLAVIQYYTQHMRTLYQKGVLQFPQQTGYSFTYIKRYDIEPLAEEITGGDGDFPNVRFQIDVEELLKSRNIFADPEQMRHDEEYGMTFIVPGGIPLNTVHRWDFWQDFKGSPPMSNVRK